jgi:arginyl-tRNA synthetase
MTDEWLEFERLELRPGLSSIEKGGEGGDGAKEALSKIESALMSSGMGGTSVVPGGTKGMKPSTADVAIALTLSLHRGIDGGSFVSSWSPALTSYVDAIAGPSSSHYSSAITLAKSLAPPPPPQSFDMTDPSLLNACSAIFANAIHVAFPAARSLDIDIRAYRCKDVKHGDYQCNVAMPLYKKLSSSGTLPPGVNSPQMLARAVADVVMGMDERENPILCDLSVNGPGFIMCRVRSSFLEDGVNDIVRDGAPTRPKRCAIGGGGGGGGGERGLAGDDNVVVVDFSSPNIAKEMHVGHLRSTIIGESVCRILEYAGMDVKRVNHVGDWGTQFGMLIQYLKEEYPDASYDGTNDGGAGAMPNITDLTEFYKNAKSRFDESPEFKKVSQLNVVSLQAGDGECLRIWKVLCDISRLEFEKVYKRLDISVEECGESFYNDKIPGVIDEFDQRGMISVEDGGAKCVFVPQFKIPLMLQKSDGGYGYDSTDMAAIKYRLDSLKARHLVYITDFTQADHFKMVFAAAKKIGWVNDDSHRLDHIGFGTVQGEDGKRFKTRSGDTVRLVDLLDEAVSRMESSLRERTSEGKANISEDEVHETACAMGYGAVKYFDLRRNPTSNYVFSYDRMLDTKGNTAIYLLYAHARLESIVTKGKAEHGIDVDALMAGGDGGDKKPRIVISHKSERNLALHLRFFADSINETLIDLFPYHICDFVYDLAIAASEFVTQCKVLGSPEMESRLLLCRATAITMRQCFDLLGIRHVMRI